MSQRACLLSGVLIFAALSAILLRGQDFKITLLDQGAVPVLAVPDLRGSGAAQGYMAAANQTLWDDLVDSGRLRIAPKSAYPKMIPQQPRDFQGAEPASRLSDWSSPPVSANYLVFGYAAIQNDVFVLYGWVYDLSHDSPQGAEMIAKRYTGSADEAGARKAAHEFAADIITLFGGQPLTGTRIYFTSDRTGAKEIWVMDADGSNQRQVTRLNFIAQYPAVSPDGSKIAFTAWPKAGMEPRIYVYSTDPVRDLRFYNQKSSVNGNPSFTPDGRELVFISTVGKAHPICIANLDGSNFRPVTRAESDDADPKVNPRNPGEIVFSSGRSGKQQVYLAAMDASDAERLTDGTGEASNPSWHPNGQTIAFAWTKGYKAGRFNIFLMDVASHAVLQVTHDEGKNENPGWSPDGTHIVFGSNRGGSFQIWRMLADGTRLRQLTTAGNNTNPVWGK